VLSDLLKLKERTIRELESLQTEPLTGGWEETFVGKVDSENHFFDIDLQESRRRTNSHNLYVPDTRSFAAVHTEIIQSLRNFLEERLSIHGG